MPPALSEVAPDLQQLPPGLGELVQKGLAKLMADRITNATDYLTLMEQISPAPLPVRMTQSSPVLVMPNGVYMTPAAGTPVVLATAPTSNLTPIPMPAVGSGSAPVVGAATPPPGSIPNIPIGAINTTNASLSIHDETVSLRGPSITPSPQGASQRAATVSTRPTVADGREIPKKWLAIAALVIVAMLILTIVIFAIYQSRSTAAAVPVPAPVVEAAAVAAAGAADEGRADDGAEEAARRRPRDDGHARCGACRRRRRAARRCAAAAAEEEAARPSPLVSAARR